ncbi:hypothetical protein ER308_16215 [Egibacter rhizosphaerae]|uniref:Peptidase M15C domain-containing protein n=1 Tax=Egibacter rhizosphaerae TaxID=1670831 RepID=A0A411YI10_9ACTN|nr:PQQ-dependent sugar dehydrogenase [Egibacter rhizosphaerae]QBI20965.1 hypothetical protein ER308_16215 [Egibacter rhizosphaerae]
MSAHPLGSTRILAAAAAAVGALALVGLVLATGSAGAAEHDGADPTVPRVAGADRFETAAEVAGDGWETAATAVVATGRDFPDALTAGALAASRDAPLLLTESDELPGATADALDDLEVEEVLLVGGPAAVDEAVAGELEGLVDDVDRLSGRDRYETAAEVAAAAAEGTDVEEALVVSGEDFADALAAGALLDGQRPVLLALPGALPQSTADALDELAPDRATLLGGEAALDAAVAEDVAALVDETDRLAGDDRYGTSIAAVTRALDEGADTEALAASGATFADGLSAGPLAARLDAPLVLVPAERLTDALDAALRDDVDLEAARIVGGEAAVSAFVAEELAAAFAGDPRPSPPEDPVEITETDIATGLDAPWDVVFRENGDVLVTERDSGRVLELDAEGGTQEVHRFDVNNAGEGGLLGLAERPGTGDLYAYYSRANENRVTRLSDPGEAEEVVFDGIPHGSIHNGGRIAFGPDGYLWVATGDAGDGQRSQDPRDPAGAILRLEPDGSVPSDNPTWDGGEPSPVYATGIRNSQGLDWDAEGRLWASEFGPDVDDEVNVITAGGNYGWPDETGVTGDPELEDPVFVRQPPVASWSGLEVLVDGAIPQWEGDVLVAALRGERLWRLEVDGDEVTASEELLTSERGRLREVVTAPDGSLWVLTNNTDGRGDPRAGDDRIIRLGAEPEATTRALNDDERDAMNGTSWEQGCPVDPPDLAIVETPHWDFAHQLRTGELVVADDIAGEVADIMSDLAAARFPIERMEPIAAYGGDDDASMEANNSSAFNCRPITGSNTWSEHSFGTAIDLNPVQNPYRRDGEVLPPAGEAYLDRGNERPGMIVEGDAVVEAFDARGWEWGGRWRSLDDWMHFERP